MFSSSKYVLQRNEKFSAVTHSRGKKFMAINWSLYPTETEMSAVLWSLGSEGL